MSEVPSTSSRPSSIVLEDEKQRGVSEARQGAGGKARRRSRFDCVRSVVKNIEDIPDHLLVSVLFFD